MQFRRVLVTGGAGFVGSHLSIRVKESFPATQVTAVDNLSRRGSELNLPRLRAAGVGFHRVDVRSRAELDALPAFDLLIDCAAEPAVTASLVAGPMPVLDTNLLGALNSFELARRHSAALLLVSSSRVYPIADLNGLPYEETPTRFRWPAGSAGPGWSAAGVREDFPLSGPRSFYGAGKLAAELVAAEHAFQCGLPLLINRCGLICGPWQMARADQGVVTLWVARHVYGQPLKYIGFGGTGKQVRDALDIEDLCRLIVSQLQHVSLWDGRVYNVGGGVERSFSLSELSALCGDLSGSSPALSGCAQTNPFDVRIYISDAGRVARELGWTPRIDLGTTLTTIHRWLTDNHEQLRSVFSA